MSIGNVIKALRVGASIKNPTPFKWAGLAFALALLALQVAQHYGFLQGVSADDWIQLVGLILVLLSQVLTTDKIGVLPAAREPLPKLRDQPLQTSRSESSGFPNGPFFDNDH